MRMLRIRGKSIANGPRGAMGEPESLDMEVSSLAGNDMQVVKSQGTLISTIEMQQNVRDRRQIQLVFAIETA
jgi:hypothetical protein